MNNKQREFLLLLADHLERFPSDRMYKMSDFGHDALAFAASIAEFKKAGFTFAHNDNRVPGRPVAHFKKHYANEAVEAFFGITRDQVDHLFGVLECDPWGVQTGKSPFADNLTSFKGAGRDNEPPGWTAGRIRVFVREYPDFESYKQKAVANDTDKVA